MRSAAFKTTEYETCPKKQLIMTVSYLSVRRAYNLWSSVRMIESCVKILTSDCYEWCCLACGNFKIFL